MNFERQKDGESWLFFERTKPRGRRRLALVRLDKETGTLGPVERLEASDEELERVKARVPSIRIPYRNKHLRTMRIAIVCEGETEARYFVAHAKFGLDRGGNRTRAHVHCLGLVTKCPQMPSFDFNCQMTGSRSDLPYF